MTSLPTYNPNKLVPDNGAARRNAVTYNLYELGSTFKPLTICAAIDNGVVTSMAKRYDATKPLAIAGFHIRDSHMIHRWLNVPEQLIHSSNNVTSHTGHQLGRENMAELFRQERQLAV